MPDNEKYITEAWIENGKEEEFKRDFLINLLQEYEGHENGLDADTVDGKHYNDILSDIQSATSNLVSEFKIGGVTFNSEKIQARQDRNKTMKVGFDGIHLFVKEADGINYEDDIYYPEYTLLPWQEGYFDIERDWESIDGEDGINLLEAFESLYEIVDEKVDQADFDLVQEKVNEADDMIKALRPNVKILYQPSSDPNSEEREIIGSEINASSVNGVYIYIVGKQAYENLPASVKNDVHNLFIIKENENSFDDALKAKQPGTVPMSSYYQFQVVFKNGEYWLQYKHEQLDTWHDMCPVSSFITDQAIESKLISVLESSDKYVINPEAFIKTLREINFNDTSNIGLIDYIKQSSIRGAISNNFKPSGAASNQLPVSTTNGIRYLNLDSFGAEILRQVGIDNIWSGINSVTNDFNSLVSGTGRIKGVEDLATSNSSQINSINSQLAGINDQLTEIGNQIEAFSNWKTYELPGYNINNDGRFVKNTYNESLKLAVVSFSFHASTKSLGGTAGSFFGPLKKGTSKTYPYTHLKAVPQSGFICNNATHPYTTAVHIDNTGELFVGFKNDVTGDVYFGGSMLYKYSKLYTDLELENLKNRE